MKIDDERGFEREKVTHELQEGLEQNVYFLIQKIQCLYFKNYSD